MSWNYRIVRHGEGDTKHYGLHEVYYKETKKGKKKIWMFGQAQMFGGTPQEIRSTLKMMLKDARKDVPILEVKEVLREVKDGK